MSGDLNPARLAKIQARKPHAYAFWSPEESVRLVELRQSGVSIAELSREFKRTSGAIRSRLRHLGMR